MLLLLGKWEALGALCSEAAAAAAAGGANPQQKGWQVQTQHFNRY